MGGGGLEVRGHQAAGDEAQFLHERCVTRATRGNPQSITTRTGAARHRRCTVHPPVNPLPPGLGARKDRHVLRSHANRTRSPGSPAGRPRPLPPDIPRPDPGSLDALPVEDGLPPHESRHLSDAGARNTWAASSICTRRPPMRRRPGPPGSGLGAIVRHQHGGGALLRRIRAKSSRRPRGWLASARTVVSSSSSGSSERAGQRGPWASPPRASAPGEARGAMPSRVSPRPPAARRGGIHTRSGGRGPRCPGPWYRRGGLLETLAMAPHSEP